MFISSNLLLDMDVCFEYMFYKLSWYQFYRFKYHSLTKTEWDVSASQVLHRKVFVNMSL